MEKWIGIRVSTEIKARLEQLARESGNRSVASIIREFIEAGITRYDRHIPLTADETPEENPTEQMHRAGCRPLVEA